MPFAVPIFALLLLASYHFRYNGIVLFDTQIPLFQMFFTHNISSPFEILTENYLLWIVLYFSSFLLLYTPPQRNMFKLWKLNPNYPSFSLIGMEIFRSLRGVLICSIYEILINQLISRGYHQWNLPGIENKSQPLEEVSPLFLLFGAIPLFIWGDFHFYWTHRLLHHPYLYQTVHKYHHESYNPDPFSGLSMHWFESSIYFSSALLLGLTGYPLFLVRLMFKSLIIFPLDGHSGYGFWDIEQTNNHYIHHSKFNWNYGSSPFWDHLMKTNYPFSSSSSLTSSQNKKNNEKNDNSEQKMKTMTKEEQRRFEESIEQAKLVGCEVSENYRDPSVASSSSSSSYGSSSSTKTKSN